MNMGIIYDDGDEYRWIKARLKSERDRIEAWRAHYVAKGCPEYKAAALAKEKGLYRHSWPNS